MWLIDTKFESVYIYEEGGKFEVSPIYRQTPF